MSALPTQLRLIETMVDQTEDGGEGSRYHFRSEFARELVADWTAADAHDPRVLDLYEDGMGYAEIKASCVNDATAALQRWIAEDSQAVTA